MSPSLSKKVYMLLHPNGLAMVSAAHSTDVRFCSVDSAGTSTASTWTDARMAKATALRYQMATGTKLTLAFYEISHTVINTEKLVYDKECEVIERIRTNSTSKNNTQIIALSWMMTRPDWDSYTHYVVISDEYLMGDEDQTVEEVAAQLNLEILHINPYLFVKDFKSAVAIKMVIPLVEIVAFNE